MADSRTLRSSPRAPVAVPAGPRAAPRRDRRISNQELRRRLLHFTPGIMAFALRLIPHMETLRLHVALAFVGLGMGVLTYLSIRLHPYYRRHPEEGSVFATIGYAIPLMALVLLCRSHLEIPLAAVAIVAFGDGSATLAGMLIGGPRLPWNRAKSVVGTAAFMAVGTLMASWLYWLEANPHVAYGTVVACVAPVVIVAALIESWRWKFNDNAVVSGATAAMLLLSQTLVVGW